MIIKNKNKNNILHCFILMKKWYPVLLILYAFEIIINYLDLLDFRGATSHYLFGIYDGYIYEILAHIILIIIVNMIIYYMINKEMFDEIYVHPFIKFIKTTLIKIIIILIIELLIMNIIIEICYEYIDNDFFIGFLINYTLIIIKYFIVYSSLSLIIRKSIYKNVTMKIFKKAIKKEKYFELVLVIALIIVITGPVLYFFHMVYMNMINSSSGLDFLDLMCVVRKPILIILGERIIKVFTNTFIIIYLHQSINNVYIYKIKY